MKTDNIECTKSVLFGGWGVIHQMTGYAPVSKNSVKRVCFSDINVVYVFLKKLFVFFIFHRLLGLSSGKNVRSIIQNGILGYHFHQHNN